MFRFTWDVDPILLRFPAWLSFLHIDGIRYYSLCYVGVFMGGYYLLDWQLRRAGAGPDEANEFVLPGVVATLVGARVGHVLFYEWDHFVRDPLWLLRIWEGGLASHGATLALPLAMWWFTKRRGQSMLEGCDRLAFSAALGATLVRAGNFFNSEIVGRATGAEWGVRFPRYDRLADPVPLRHPSQLYEVGLGLVVMGALVVADRVLGREKRPRGALFSLFAGLYFSGRFIVEYFKEYQTLPGGSLLTMGQWLSIVPATGGFLGLALSLRLKIPARWNGPAAEAATPKGRPGPGGQTPEGDPDVDAVLYDES